MNARSFRPARAAALCWVAGGLALAAQAGTVSSSYAPVTLNALVSMEATQEALAGLVLARPAADATTLSGQWAGSIDDNGWSLDFTGSWATDNLTMHHSGALDVPGDAATWTYSGLLAGESFSGEGRIDFDPRWWQIFLKGLLRVVVYGAQTVVDGGTATKLVSDGVVYVGDKIVEHYLPEESTITPTPPPPSTPPVAGVDSGLTSTLVMIDSGYRFDQVGTLYADYTTTFTTDVTPVPELGMAWLWLLGVPATLLRRRRVAGPVCQSPHAQQAV